MRTTMLAIVLVLPNTLVLAVAVNAKADRPKPAASRKASTIRLAAQGQVVSNRAALAPRAKSLATEVRDDKRLVSVLLRRENIAIANQRRALRVLGRLMTRNSRLPGSFQNLLAASARRIQASSLAIQLREQRILLRYFRIDRTLTLIRQLAPTTTGLDAFLRRQASLNAPIENLQRFQARLGVESLPDTPAFPPGKPPASPVQA